MFSKEESTLLRQEFWTAFGKSFPNKWILYNTKIKDFSFKFYFDTKKAMVMLDIEGSLDNREKYYNKILSLQNILTEEYLPNVKFKFDFLLENNKEISRIYVEKENVCIHNKNTWQSTMEFFEENMKIFENFWLEYEDFIKEDF
ncbi:MAG: DUF4268 domain-containing protein [Capnocytophaga sp.]|nr:DUF4268 domain-containing protein [Capnocytophaga sp.]